MLANLLSFFIAGVDVCLSFLTSALGFVILRNIPRRNGAGPGGRHEMRYTTKAIRVSLFVEIDKRWS